MLNRMTISGLALAATLALLASPAAATHVGCGDVITQSTTLDSDLIDCPGDGVVIGASGITFDLAGHTIDGTNQAAGGHGVRNAGADDVAVVNGRIQQFQNGLSILLSGSSLVTGLDIADSGSGVYLEEASLTQILDNNIRSSGAGITLFREGNFNLIQNNSLAVNGTAVFVAGFGSERPQQTEIADNDVLGNSAGIFLGGALRSEVRGNRVVDNKEDGITEGAGSGFSLIEGNIASGNGSDGISIFGSFETVVAGNRTWDNGTDGVLVASGTRVAIRDNFSKGNGDDGIDVDAAGTTIARNKANVNADLGIEAVPGVIDGGGNKAHGNGNPAQCVNVSCK